MKSNSISLLNPLFYDPFTNKSVVTLDSAMKQLSDVFKIPKQNIVPIQYADPETKNFIVAPRVFILNHNGTVLKVRYNSDISEASAVICRAQFAYNLGIPASKPIEFRENFSVFEYITGDLMTLEDSSSHTREISAIQSKMNTVVFDNNVDDYVRAMTKNMVNCCLDYLIQKNINAVILRKLDKLPNRLCDLKASFDHQDYGIHNLLIDETHRIRVVDEEAFGVLPLGYGIVRPIFDRHNYRVVREKGDLSYLDLFTNDQKRYFIDHLDILRALFILRNSVRRFVVGNDVSANMLLRESAELK